MGLFSAWRGEEGGRIGARDDEEREGGKPGEGVSGVAGLEGGNGDGLELVSSVELSDSLRKWVYLVFGTSSIVSPQYQFIIFFTPAEVHTGSGASMKVPLSRFLKFSSKKDKRPSVGLPRRKSCVHLSGVLSSTRRQATETPSAVHSGFIRGQSAVGKRRGGRKRCVPANGRKFVLSAPGRVMLSSVHCGDVITVCRVPPPLGRTDDETARSLCHYVKQYLWASCLDLAARACDPAVVLRTMENQHQ